MIHALRNEHDVQKYVSSLKNFYGELSSYILVVTISLIVWLLSGGGYFWPIWVILIWGIVLFLKASKLHIISPLYYSKSHDLREKLPFIKEEWSQQKAQEILKKLNISRMTPASGSNASKKNGMKKTTKKKALAKKNKK
jgi:hypothetical protein